jgi:acetyltransferase-like isoleucine patch superfamily enzyme
MKAFLRKILRRLVHAGRVEPSNVTCRERVYGLTTTALHASACISVWPESDSSQSAVRFGEQVYIGRDVEISAIGPGSVWVGDHVSFQDRCQIYGDISIGSYCIFAKNILVISTIHHIRDNPTWLIRDQDRDFLSNMATQARRAGTRVQIEEDCWLGWGCAVMPGVYIGRGAVIGANSVVTKDVAPYDVHGGAPNRKIGSRLGFSPPRQVCAKDDQALPYFYRGFRQQQADLARSRPMGGLEASQATALVLVYEPIPVVRITGVVLPSSAPLALHIFIAGRHCGVHRLGSGPFQITIQPDSMTTPVRPVPKPLEGTTYVEILADGLGQGPHFLMTHAEVSSALAV